MNLQLAKEGEGFNHFATFLGSGHVPATGLGSRRPRDKNPALSTLKLTAYRAPPPNMVTRSYLGGLGAQCGARTALELASSDRGCAWK